MKIKKKRNNHSKGPRREQTKLGKLKNQGGKHLQCGLRVNGKEKSRLKLERLVGRGDHVGLCKQGERVWILYIVQGETFG